MRGQRTLLFTRVGIPYLGASANFWGFFVHLLHLCRLINHWPKSPKSKWEFGISSHLLRLFSEVGRIGLWIWKKSKNPILFWIGFGLKINFGGLLDCHLRIGLPIQSMKFHYQLKFCIYCIWIDQKNWSTDSYFKDLPILCTESVISLDTYIQWKICVPPNVYVFEPVFRSAVAEQFSATRKLQNYSHRK